MLAQLPKLESLSVDAEFADRCRKLTIQERAKLEASIDVYGCLDPIIVWAHHGSTIVDGHHRYEICRALGKPFKTEYLTFANREEVLQFIDDHQEGRRNESDKEQAYRRGRKYRDEVTPRGGDRKSKPHAAALNGKSAETLADETGWSVDTLQRDAAFSAAVDELHPDVVPDALDDQSGLTRKDVKKLASLPQAEQPKAAADIKDQRKAKSNGAAVKTKEQKTKSFSDTCKWAARSGKPHSRKEIAEYSGKSIGASNRDIAGAIQSRGYIVTDVGDERVLTKRAVHFALDLSDDDMGDLQTAMKRLVELADEFRAAKSVTRCGKWTTDEEVEFISQVDSIAKRFLQG